MAHDGAAPLCLSCCGRDVLVQVGPGRSGKWGMTAVSTPGVSFQVVIRAVAMAGVVVLGAALLAPASASVAAGGASPTGWHVQASFPPPPQLTRFHVPRPRCAWAWAWVRSSPPSTAGQAGRQKASRAGASHSKQSPVRRHRSAWRLATARSSQPPMAGQRGQKRLSRTGSPPSQESPVRRRRCAWPWVTTSCRGSPYRRQTGVQRGVPRRIRQASHC